MIRPEALDPHDVLAHLKCLGFDSVSPRQLKEFVHDLKKLIKYEQNRDFKNSFETDSVSRYSSEQVCECRDYDKPSTVTSSSECACDCCVSICSSSESQHSRYRESRHSGRNPSESCVAFIRPWNIHGCSGHSSRSRRNQDPVQLYHQYKTCWKNQCIPGESKHSGLRWCIRNKMLGEEPRPKVCFGHKRRY